jgi:hypothetical protein
MILRHCEGTYFPDLNTGVWVFHARHTTIRRDADNGLLVPDIRVGTVEWYHLPW